MHEVEEDENGELKIKPGIYDIPENRYHTGFGLSQSALCHMIDSPEHYKYARENPMKRTHAMEFGSLYHPTILEPEKVEGIVAYGPDKERRSKADREEWAQFFYSNKDKIILNHDGYVMCMDEYGKMTKDSKLCMGMAVKMKNAIYANPDSRRALEVEGETEMSLYVEDEISGILKRCRIDKIPSGGNTLIDVKTTEDASESGFMRSILKYRYHIQAAWYLDIANQLGLERERFVFIAQEKKEPFHVDVYTLPDELVEIGRITYRNCLNKLERCIEKDSWPGYTEGVVELPCPAYARPEGL